MSETFVIDIWSDVVCPFCYLGSRQLTAALERFEHREDVTLRHRAFELDPRAQFAYDRPLAELVAAKYAMPVAQVHTMHERLENNAHALGMTWSLDTAKPTNTFDAHRVIALASSQGLGDEASERLFRAYFCEGELVSDHQRLSELAGEVGVSDVDAQQHASAARGVDRMRAVELHLEHARHRIGMAHRGDEGKFCHEAERCPPEPMGPHPCEHP